MSLFRPNTTIGRTGSALNCAVNNARQTPAQGICIGDRETKVSRTRKQNK